MIFERGYQKAREKTEKGSKFIRNCSNCMYFGRERKNSSHEVCLNNGVTQYDIIVDGNSVYCALWVPYTKGLTDSVFGRSKRNKDFEDW